MNGAPVAALGIGTLARLATPLLLAAALADPALADENQTLNIDNWSDCTPRAPSRASLVISSSVRLGINPRIDAPATLFLVTATVPIAGRLLRRRS